jgi:HK97 family phage portal protein
MAWNSGSNKALQSGSQKSILTPGAPVAFNTGIAGKPYRDSWDIERAYREGMSKVTWVTRCIDAIAGNQARLPVILRQDNSPSGKIVTDNKNNSILDILNTKSNMGENSFVFRYRLSSQLLLSSRGAFIEKVRGRDGSVVALQLLPPQHTAPIPDPKRFVAGFEVDMRNGTKIVLPPKDVIWIRKPHPLDPYLSLTPLESAGIAVEIENLSKIYNRNFLLNDGRPGGMIVVRGEIDDDDKDELRARFRGNINRAGAITVVSSDEGVDYVDTGASPRDANYIQMRQITKEEILAAFGVPESVIGNASGRTFSNAGEEHRVFWNETLLPHLELIARGLDELDPDYYIDFDTSDVPILILYKQERERYLLDEFQNGLISGNEYRAETGRKRVDSDLMQAMLANPNLTPIGYTDRRFDSQEQAQQQAAMMGGQPGMPGVAAAGMMPAAPPDQGGGAEQPTPPEMGSIPAQVINLDAGQPQEGMTATLNAEAAQQVAPTMASPSALSAFDAEMQVKSDFIRNEWEVKADQSADTWTEILDRTLERFFERQQRVVLEKTLGAKSRKAIDAGSLDVDSVYDIAVWNKQIEDDVRPVVSGIIKDASQIASEQTGIPVDMDEEEIKSMIDAQMERIKKTNNTTKDEIASAILIALALSDDEDRAGMLKAALSAIFINLLAKRKRAIAEHEAQSAYNGGTYFGARQSGATSKTWVTRKDAKVRGEHKLLENKTVGLIDDFQIGPETLRFPGDPLAPPHLTMNCRCKLRFSTS